jgi:hypothetical protein
MRAPHAIPIAHAQYATIKNRLAHPTNACTSSGSVDVTGRHGHIVPDGDNWENAETWRTP